MFCVRYIQQITFSLSISVFVTIVESPSLVFGVEYFNKRVDAACCHTDESKQDVSMDPYYDAVAKTSFIGLVTATNVVVNTLVIIVIVKYPQLREDRSTLFIFSLTISDLANGITAMPISAYLCYNETVNGWFILKTHRFFIRVFAMIGLHSLSWVTLTKMVAILHPFRYEQLLSRKRCNVVIVCIWLISAAITAIGIRLDVEWNQGHCISANAYYRKPLSTQIGLTLGVVLPLAITLYASARILMVIVKTNRQIATQVSSISGLVSDAALPNPSITVQSLRSGRNILMICAAALIFTLPMFVYILFNMVLNIELPMAFQFASVWILMCNSSANGILYLSLFRNVRKRLFQMFGELHNLCCYR